MPHNSKRNLRYVIIIATILLVAAMFGAGSLNALASDTTPTPTPFPTSINNAGFSRQNPVPPNTRLSIRTTSNSDGTVIDWEMSISQVEFGPTTTAKIAKFNQFNNKPESGKDYLIAYVQGRVYSITGKTQTFSVSSGEFGTVSDGNILTTPDSFLISGLDPILNFKGFAGAKFSGWIVLTVFSDDPMPLITYALQKDGIQGIWFSTSSEISPTEAASGIATESSTIAPTQTADSTPGSVTTVIVSPVVTSGPTLARTSSVALAIINAMPAQIGRFTLSRDPKLTYVATLQGTVVGDRITYNTNGGAQLDFAIWIGQDAYYAVSRYNVELSRLTVPFITVEVGDRAFVAPTNKGRDDTLTFNPTPWGVAIFRNIVIDLYPTKTLSDEISITKDEAVQLLQAAIDAIPQ